MDIADWNGVPLRRRLRSADRFNDSAIRCASFNLNTPLSRSSALLWRVTFADQNRLGRLAAIILHLITPRAYPVWPAEWLPVPAWFFQLASIVPAAFQRLFCPARWLAMQNAIFQPFDHATCAGLPVIGRAPQLPPSLSALASSSQLRAPIPARHASS